MPYLLMRHVATGRLIWIANFHNPASTRSRGDQSKWRTKAKAKRSRWPTGCTRAACR